MPRFPLILSALALAAHPIVADPYCDALLDPDTVGTSYKRLAPIYSDTEAGWIIASDQLRQDYALKDSAVALVAQIVEEVRGRGVELAVLVAPPRPIVAGQAVREAVLPDDAGYDATAAAESFHALIDQISGAGTIAPDLLRMTEGRERLARAFYFARDTHWTQEGASQSALALARALAEAGVPGIDPADIPRDVHLSADRTYEEKGSLSKVIGDVCGTMPEPASVPEVLLRSGDVGLGLLDEVPFSAGPRIALLGTSFSDRYGRDVYRAADAIAHATGLEVDNLSVSGGGALSAFESYVLSGALDRGDHEVLVWEMPYTTAFRSVSGLRQLLGALRASAPHQPLAEVTLPASGEMELAIPEGPSRSLLIEVAPVNGGAQQLHGKVHYDNGSSTKITFYRSAHMPAAELATPIRMSIAASTKRRPVAINLTFDPDRTAGSTLSVHALN